MFDVYIRYRVSLYNLNRSESGEGETRDSINARTNQTRPIDVGFHIFHRESVKNPSLTKLIILIY